MMTRNAPACWSRKTPVACMSVLATLLVAGCYVPENDPAPNAEVIQALQIVPATALDDAKAGKIDDGSYRKGVADPFLNNTYVMTSEGSFLLAAWNGADKGVSDFALENNKYKLVTDIFNLENAQVVVSIQDKSKLQSIIINGIAYDSSRFTFGMPALPNGEDLTSDGRLPGDYAMVPIGALPAQQSANVLVELKGACGLTVHLDLYGKAYCQKALTTNPLSGTTLVYYGPECKEPDCTNHPEDPRCTPDCEKNPWDTRCLPDCSVNPLDWRCLPDCVNHPEDTRCFPNCEIDWSDVRCTPDCVKHPEDTRCPLDCVNHPTDNRCPLDCVKNPTDNRCPLDCVSHPEDTRCPLDCVAHPTDDRCPVNCVTNPFDPRCTPDCTANPEDSRCHPNCKTDPTNPLCGCVRKPDYWKNNSGCLNPSASVTPKCTCTKPDLVTKWLPIWLGNVNGAQSLRVATLQNAVDVFAMTVYGSPTNGITVLYNQLLTAKLNIKNGAASWSVAKVVSAADTFLATHNFNSWSSLSAQQKADLNTWTTALTNYNNGLLEPGLCQ